MYIIYIAENKYFDYSYNGNEENELEKILTPFTAKNEIIPKCIYNSGPRSTAEPGGTRTTLDCPKWYRILVLYIS